MNLGFAVEAALPGLRAAAESRMTDTCRVTKPGAGAGNLDPDTGVRTNPIPVTVYQGPCRLGRVDVPNVQAAAGGEATWETQDSVLHLPAIAAAGVRPDMTVEYLTAAHNPALVGKQFGVIGVVGSSQATAHRCLVREVVS